MRRAPYYALVCCRSHDRVVEVRSTIDEVLMCPIISKPAYMLRVPADKVHDESKLFAYIDYAVEHGTTVPIQ